MAQLNRLYPRRSRRITVPLTVLEERAIRRVARDRKVKPSNLLRTMCVDDAVREYENTLQWDREQKGASHDQSPSRTR